MSIFFLDRFLTNLLRVGGGRWPEADGPMLARFELEDKMIV